MNQTLKNLLAFVEKHEPPEGYFGPETLADLLLGDPQTLAEFRSLFEGVTAEQLDGLEDHDPYGWIVAGAADELDLLPDDPRHFFRGSLDGKTEAELIGLLGSACVLNDVETVRRIAVLCDVNKLDHNRQAAIGYAIGNNHIECVRVLLENKARANAKIDNGSTPMHICASTRSSKDIWKLLIEYGGDPLKPNEHGQSARSFLKMMGRQNWET